MAGGANALAERTAGRPWEEPHSPLLAGTPFKHLVGRPGRSLRPVAITEGYYSLEKGDRQAAANTGKCKRSSKLRIVLLWWRVRRICTVTEPWQHLNHCVEAYLAHVKKKKKMMIYPREACAFSNMCCLKNTFEGTFSNHVQKLVVHGIMQGFPVELEGAGASWPAAADFLEQTQPCATHVNRVHCKKRP